MALNEQERQLEVQKQSAQTGRGQLWLRRIAWSGIGLLLLWMLAWVAVPPLLKWQMQVRLSELLGRTVTIGDVGFKPWTLEFTVGNLEIAGEPSAPGAAASAGTAAASASSGKKVEPLLQLQRLHVNVSGSSLFKFAPVIEELDIDSPVVRIAHLSPGHYDIDDLIERFATKPDAKKEASEPARFALYNVQLRNAQVRFDDKPVARVHKLEALDLSLPFISNLPTQLDVKVEPRLAFKLNGSAFDSGAQATPFAQARNGTLNWKTPDFDLAPYLAYLPESLPVRIKQGALSADVALQFEAPQGGEAKVSLKGNVGARDLVVTDPAGGPLLNWRKLQLGLRDVRPLAHQLAFDTLRLEGAQLFVTRGNDGQINLLKLAGGAAAPASSPAESKAVPASAASAASNGAAPAASAPRTQATAANAWQVSLGAIELADARVQWSDAASKPDVALQIDSLAVDVKQVNWPVASPMPLHVAGTLRSQTQGAAPSGTFTVDGPVTERDAKLDVKLDGVALDLFAPYVGQFLTAKVDGHLAAQAQLDWSGAADAQRLKVAVEKAALDGLRVHEASAGRAAAHASEGKGQGKNKSESSAPASLTEGVALKQLALADVQLDVIARSATVGSVKLVEPNVGVVRERDGKLGVQRWLVGESGDAASPSKPAARPAAKSAEAPWQVVLKNFAVDNGQIQLIDNAALRSDAKTPSRIEVSALKVGLQNFEWRGPRAVPPAKLSVTARVGSPGARGDRGGRNGLIDWNGQVGMQPLLANGKLKIERLPVHLFTPYAGALPVDIVRAEAGYSGTVAVRQSDAGLDVNAGGDVLLGDVHVTTLQDANTRAGFTSADELLNWQALSLKGLSFAMKPSAKPVLEIREAALNDFYSRLIVTEQGRFNLQEVAAPSAPASGVASGAASAPASGAASPPSSAPAAAVAAPAASAAASAPPGAGLPIDVRIGATKLINGKVDFTDHFVRPNYSAALTELNGQLGAFRSDSREMATLELRGRAAGTALLEISGQVNPTVKPLALDIRAKASDLELAPLSPYAGKYAGYAIERGKLTMDVSYKIDADGKLNASNQVVLNQLTFGEKIASPDATKLPVLLAVALLKDRNGVIDINLPVSGSINDPQFSVGGIIVKVIINLITKALTAPFSLLSGGGKDDLSLVEFRPGTSIISGDSSSTIDKVAKALDDRPSLKMTVTGAADPASEREAFQQAALEARLLAEQRREALRSGTAPAAPASSASGAAASAGNVPPMSTEERNRLLKEVYKQTEIPNKPRNVLGMQKDIPPAEMEAMLKTRLVVTEEAMRELALQRGIAVRDALIAKGLPSERLFLAAPKLRVSGEEDAKWTPRVQLTLSAN